MFTLIERPLTLDLAARLPAGAHKLLNAARLEPGATNRRYQELTGYRERSIRSFIAVLVEVGLAERIAYQPAKASANPLTAEQQAIFEQLYAFGVTESAAKRLACTCSSELVQAGLRYIRSMQSRNPAGYLVWCLDNPAKWFMPLGQQADVPERAVNVGEATVTAELIAESLERGLAALPLHELVVQGVTVTNDNREAVLLAYAVEAATGVDVRLDEGARQTIQSLHQAGYVAEDVAIFADELFPDQDWRGRKGEKPTLALLRQGIAGTKHRLTSARSLAIGDGGLLKRVQAIRAYLPEDQPIRCLADLWSDEVRQALDRSRHAETYCPDCGLGWSLCRCGKPEPLPTYKDADARMWGALIGQLSVQLNQAMFNCWVRDLRLVGFQAGADAEYDTFTAVVVSHYVKDWLERHLMVAMVETLSKMHQKAVQIEFVIDK